ncbi:1-acyl-sn-glycerol-3-phosphate acyltransferase [Parasphaerochaeta coccoides]|uniref:Acyltransferase n=1 Tax=Parasphaerochaeta coccoides (strain ATCC BAA-1237 / DSM 17374 / SPN1) TaxID=760011 RepID=F4GIC5_PARC1|nr:1-acyl-sn-glycerol-3-phosphate acyltransferase [Parasphaerochaeta coccoides]AEC01633.1 acyltransferase [Parasphaerochaeta coccoides DSM 17374]
MDRSKYTDIAPYDEKEIAAAVARLQAKPGIYDVITDLIIKSNPLTAWYKKSVFKDKFQESLAQVRSYDDFQRNITAGIFIPAILKGSVDDFSYSGVQELDHSKPYLFISNHRDIVLDCALLDYALLNEGHNLCEMAIGDNLLIHPLALDLFKLNGGVTVKRTLPLREKYLESIRLSRYFVELITEEKTSIWIAQKSGRAKDGIDVTSPSIIKMLYLSSKTKGIGFSDLINACNIVPVAISYQYDPCDINKGREEISKKLHGGEYTKRKYEDILNMLRGLRKYKGNIHIAFGTKLEGNFQDPNEVAAEIDRQIHMNYRLWDTNYFAYDYVTDSQDYAGEYESLNQRKFLARYKRLSHDVRTYVLNAYANPVRSRLAAEGAGAYPCSLEAII